MIRRPHVRLLIPLMCLIGPYTVTGIEPTQTAETVWTWTRPNGGEVAMIFLLSDRSDRLLRHSIVPNQDLLGVWLIGN